MKILKRFIIRIFFFIAICDGKTNLNGACEQFQLVQKKSGWQLEHSKGACIYPRQCSCSSIYFYSDGPRCKGKDTSRLKFEKLLNNIFNVDNNEMYFDRYELLFFYPNYMGEFLREITWRLFFLYQKYWIADTAEKWMFNNSCILF